MTYDCFTLFNELDLLEIRLNILDPHVDYFVICESTQTFSGRSKPLYFDANKERFARWAHKIIHVVSPRYLHGGPFDRAAFQKDYLRSALASRDMNDDDIVYFGDLDEIWKPQEIVDDKVYSLEQLNYCYFFNNRSSETWVGTIVGKWKTVKTNTFNYWRANHENVLKDGGWHFTNMGGVDQIKRKLEAYDHQEFNTPEVKEALIERVKGGKDYVGRGIDWQGRAFEMWIDEDELPQYIKDNKENWYAYFK